MVDAHGKHSEFPAVCLALISYHYSKGDPKRGCAGFDFGTDEDALILHGADGALFNLADPIRPRHYLYGPDQ